jgi:LmbE family N-acetylglucosaminyl deacetylase
MNAVRPSAAKAFAPQPPTSRIIEGHGTPDAVWQAWGGIASLPAVDVAALAPPGGRAIVVAPHPDDEVLACGGLLQLLQAQGTRTVLLAVTDGDASHPGSTLLPPDTLARLRPQETVAALRALGLGPTAGAGAGSAMRTGSDAGSEAGAVARAPAPPQVLRARIGDGQVGANIEQLQTLLHQLLRPADTVFVTWRQDGHPDHEACGLAAAMAARVCGARLVEMPVWTWHWAAPGDNRVPWHRARRLDLSPEVVQRKRQAVACFATQLENDPTTGQPAILPPHVLARLLHPYEIYFT